MTIGLQIEELNGLPEPEIIETLDAEAIILRMRDELVSLFPLIEPVIDLESEPSRKLIETFAFAETIIRGRINDALRSNLLAYAQGTDLDNLAAFYDITRMVDAETSVIETDDRFRERVVLAIRGRSTGGTEPRYRSIAMEADLNVREALAYTLGKDPTVYVSIFSVDNSGVPTPELIDVVQAALNASHVRMVNDQIVVVSAVEATIDIVAKVWLLPGADNEVIDNLPSTIAGLWDEANDLGLDMTISWLTAKMMQPGVQRVEIVSPSSDVIVDPNKALLIGAVNIQDQGRDF